MPSKTESIACPVCGSTQTHTFFRQRDIPTQAGYLAPSRAGALNCTLGDIILQHCLECAHIWNSSFDPNKLGFDPNYDFSQYHSSVYRDYIATTLDRLNSRYGLVGKAALDVGCGKGEYLRMLLSAGVAKAIGFDPTFVDTDFTDEDRRRITVYRKYYGPEDSALRPDLVTCRSVLQYVPEPRRLLSSIRKTLDSQLNTIVYFEVPNGAEAFREKIVWYVAYEAGCFFSPSSLARIFRECGFQVLDIISSLGASQLEIEAKPSTSPRLYQSESPELIAQVASQVEGFAEEYSRQVSKWTERFDEYRRLEKRVVLWGAGMRAISLLVNVPLASTGVDHVVDVNPQRQGRYMPKTGQQVIAPEQLREIAPDVVIATNPNYASEIAAQISALGVRCSFEVLR